MTFSVHTGTLNEHNIFLCAVLFLYVIFGHIVLNTSMYSTQYFYNTSVETRNSAKCYWLLVLVNQNELRAKL